MSFKSWEKPQGFLPPGQYELDPTEPINQAGPPIGAWYAANLPGGPQLVDLSRNGNHGALQNGASWVAGRGGPELEFDGARVTPRQYVDVDYETPPSTQPITCVARVRPESFLDFLGVASTSKQGQFNQWIFYVHGGGELGVFMSSHFRTTNTLSVGVQNDIAFTFDGSTLEQYIDGALSRTDTGVSYTATAEDKLAIGNFVINGEGGSTNRSFHGGILSVLLFHRALPAPDIRTLHHDPYALLRPVRRWWAVAIGVGITHPVIGSGIINSEAIIGGTS